VNGSIIFFLTVSVLQSKSLEMLLEFSYYNMHLFCADTVTLFQYIKCSNVSSGSFTEGKLIILQLC